MRIRFLFLAAALVRGSVSLRCGRGFGAVDGALESRGHVRLAVLLDLYEGVEAVAVRVSEENEV